MQTLKGKKVFITGVSRKEGIGFALAQACAQAGADIFYTYWSAYDRSTEPSAADADALLTQLRSYGTNVQCMECDLSAPDASHTLFTAMVGSFGAPDVLINNACYSTNQPFSALTSELLDAHYFVNMRAVVLLCKEFVSHFTAHEGVIVNLTSGQSVSIMKDELPYTMTKASVDMLTMQLAPELHEKGITLFSVDPGPTDTGWMTEAIKEAVLRDSLKGSITSPQEVAAFIIEKIVSDEPLVGMVLHVPR